MAIGKAIGCSRTSVRDTLLEHQKGAPVDSWVPRNSRLDVREREGFLLGLHRSESIRSIARSLGRATSTVTREVAVNRGRESYRIWPAHQRGHECTRRPKDATFDSPAYVQR
jgi:IS30 family transposase